MTPIKTAEVVEAIENWYPPALAEAWDRIGLVVGRRDLVVKQILLTIDVTDDVIQQAIDLGANLIIAHHPLDLNELPEIVTQQHVARIISIASQNEIAIYIAHTNADHAGNGITDALLSALGISADRSITDANQLVGTGRVGKLPTALTLYEFANLVSSVLPNNFNGVKFAGNPNRPISTVAACGGSGASLLPIVAQLDADVFLTADLKHHAAQDHLANSDIALVNISHWASEWLWLATLAKKLNQEFPVVKTVISEICTDPWTGHVDTWSSR